VRKNLVNEIRYAWNIQHIFLFGFLCMLKSWDGFFFSKVLFIPRLWYSRMVLCLVVDWEAWMVQKTVKLIHDG